MAKPQPHQLGCVSLSKLLILSELYHPSQDVMKIACGDLLHSSSRVSGTQEMHNKLSSSTFIGPFSSPLSPHPPHPISPLHHLSEALKPRHTNTWAKDNYSLKIPVRLPSR